MPKHCGNCGATGHNKRTCRVSTQNTDPLLTQLPTSTTVIEADTCPICMETLEKTNYASTKCGHQFCLDCLIRHVGNKANCPICRADVGKPTPDLELSIFITLRSNLAHILAQPVHLVVAEVHNQHDAVNNMLERYILDNNVGSIVYTRPNRV